MTFRCNICGVQGSLPDGPLPRDAPTCHACGSNVRLRALMHAFSMELFGVPIALPDFPEMKSLRGLGMSDDRSCASLLARKFDYTNTFYHQSPRFDIASPDPAERARYDFVISSEIFEHVAPPVGQAFANVLAMLKPGGFLAMTVPYSPWPATIEHFPDLYQYRVTSIGGRLALVNRTRSGEWQVFDNLVFHGGPGSTLELRVFCENDLRRDLAAAGFRRIRFAAEDEPAFGIIHENEWSLPLIAGLESFRPPRETVTEMMAGHAAALEHLRKLEAERVRLEGERARLDRLCLELNRHAEQADAEAARKSQWAASADEELRAAREQLAGAIRHQDELRQWAQNAVDESQSTRAEVARLQTELNERTEWAQRLEVEVKQRAREAQEALQQAEALRRRLEAWQSSRWFHLGRTFGLGPR